MMKVVHCFHHQEETPSLCVVCVEATLLDLLLNLWRIFRLSEVRGHMCVSLLQAELNLEGLIM